MRLASMQEGTYINGETGSMESLPVIRRNSRNGHYEERYDLLVQLYGET
jgi:hypothetical protein